MSSVSGNILIESFTATDATTDRERNSSAHKHKLFGIQAITKVKAIASQTFHIGDKYLCCYFFVINYNVNSIRFHFSQLDRLISKITKKKSITHN